jgi:hypothetical protein
MTFNINRIRDNIAGYGYLKQNKFEVFVKEPPIFQNSPSLNNNGNVLNVNTINDMHRFRIEQVRAPGVSLLSADVRRYGIGPNQKFPYNAQYFDTTFSVLVDKDTFIWDFWYSWVNSIFNFNGTEASGNNLISGGRIPTYTTRYKDDYSTIMMIVIYDDFGNTVKTINLYDAFPSSVKEIPLAWGDSQTLMRLSVSITYSTYTIVGSNVENNSNQSTLVRRSSATPSATTTITS